MPAELADHAEKEVSNKSASFCHDVIIAERRSPPLTLPLLSSWTKMEVDSRE